MGQDVIIKDGTGTGCYSAKVTKNNRLQTSGVNLSLIEIASESGDTYNLNTSTVALSTTGESALLYLKNNEDDDLIIDSLIVNIKDYVGTNGQPTLKIYKKPTAGTLISAATLAEQHNRNYGSSKTLDVTLFQGVEGSTITSYESVIPVFLPSTAVLTLVQFDTIIVLPKGASMAISYVPPSGMTTTNIVAAVNCTLNGSQL